MAGGENGCAEAAGEVVGLSHVALGLHVLHFASRSEHMLSSRTGLARGGDDVEK